MFRKEGDPVSPVGATPRSFVPAGLTGRKSTRKEPPQTRQSRGLEQFFFNIRDVVGLSVLDSAGANQENINFLINLGHKVYTSNLVHSIDETFGGDAAEQTNVSRIDDFLRQNFDYPPDTLDAVLLWDSLQFMAPPLLNATIERLYEVMRPKSYLLALFTATERVAEVPSHSFRIVDNKTIQIAERDVRPAGQVFNNRNLEKLFGKFESVKFFLTRENLREVIVRR
jgi:hypothetical protein